MVNIPIINRSCWIPEAVILLPVVKRSPNLTMMHYLCCNGSDLVVAMVVTMEMYYMTTAGWCWYAGLIWPYLAFCVTITEGGQQGVFACSSPRGLPDPGNMTEGGGGGYVYLAQVSGWGALTCTWFRLGPMVYLWPNSSWLGFQWFDLWPNSSWLGPGFGPPEVWPLT